MKTCLFTLIALFLLSPSEARIARTRCDFSQGNWVRDDSYPLYLSSQCPFILTEFDCRKNGRPDDDYTKFRWQPHGCELPRFDAHGFLEKLRGKRLIFVGDSLSSNQWQSLACLLHVAFPHAIYTLQTINGLSTFTFPEFGFSLLFLRNAFLVDIVEEPAGRVLKLESISSSRVWGGMDVMIFDSWHWWLHSGRKQPWEWVVEGKRIVRDMDRLVAYERALKTWANWIDSNVDTTKTQVFFQGVSPDHDGGLWETCAGKWRPTGPGTGSRHPGEVLLERVLAAMEKPVHLLNITAMSQMRIDGHPSFYGSRSHRGMDCTHWCLSGVPDTWNQYLYALLN